jgi:hypothetical protein
MEGVVGVLLTVSAVVAQADTGVWINVSGGYWTDTNNWQNGYVPLGSPNAADFSVLGPGETVTVTNYTGIGAILFTGAGDDVWTLSGSSMGSRFRRCIQTKIWGRSVLRGEP